MTAVLGSSPNAPGGTRLPFPAGFLWGASTSAHQVEGNNINNDWWVMENAPGSQVFERSGDAADSYHRYRADMRLLADAGLNSYRFSIEWSRIEPEPGLVSRAAVDHYRRMVEAAHEFNLSPIVTLMHFTIPRWMHQTGSWRSPAAADLFARFTELALPIVSDGVEYVCTINEPNIAAMLAGGGDTVAEPGQLAAPDLKVADTLLEAHVQSRAVLSSVGGLRSGWTVATQAYQALDVPGAFEKAHELGRSREDWYLEAAADDDFVGVQAYTRTLVGPEGPLPVADSCETTLTNWEYYPPAAEIGVRNAWKLSAGVPILVTENGIATSDDERRIAYTEDALRGLHAAIGDGIEVVGYLHWSALDNFEWAAGFKPTFGLIAVDRETFERSPKPSLDWLGRVARMNGLDGR
jgi:beta-glucosidase